MANVEVTVVIKHIGKQALTVEGADDNIVHLPFSQLKGGPEPCDWDVGMSTVFEIPEWLAIKEGLA